MTPDDCKDERVLSTAAPKPLAVTGIVYRRFAFVIKDLTGNPLLEPLFEFWAEEDPNAWGPTAT
jgi:hypothetical protein